MAIAVMFAAMAGLGSFVSCKKDIAVGQDDKKPEIVLNKDEIEFSPEASEMYVSLESNVDWTASTDASWITFDPASEKAGSRKVKVSVEENAHEKGRSALVRFVAVSDEDCVAELIVNQLYKAVDPTAPYPAESRWTLYVPTGCKSAYSNRSPWNKFKAIVEDGSLRR